MDLMEAKRQSHALRNSQLFDVVIDSNGANLSDMSDKPEIDLDAVLASDRQPNSLPFPMPTEEDIFPPDKEDFREDITNPLPGLAVGVGRAIAGGVQDAALGIVSTTEDIAEALETTTIGRGIGFIVPGIRGYQYTRKQLPGGIRLDDAIDQSLKDMGLRVPEGDGTLESLARGLVQFGAGMAAAPVRGAGYLNVMLKSGFADAFFDPEDGNLASLLVDLELDSAVLEYLDSRVDEDAPAAERLEARFKQALEGMGLGIPVDIIVKGFRIAKGSDKFSGAIRDKLIGMGESADARIDARDPKNTLSSGMDPTLITDPIISAAGRKAQQGLETLDELPQAPLASEVVNIQADEAINILDIRAEQMQLAPKDRVQPSGENMFDTSPESYNQTFPAQIDTPVPRAPEGTTLPLGDRARKVIEMSDVIADKLAERAKPFVGTNVQFFYNTGPIIDKATELGYTQEQAFEALRRFAKNYAATSPRTKTEENLRSASLAGVKQERGIDIGTIIGPGGTGINEKGYPMIINPGGLHRKLLDDVMASGISFDTNPKPATFAENVSGNLAGVTVDTHAIRAVFDVLNELEPGSIPLKFIGGKTAAKTKEYQAMYENDPSSFDAATMVADTLGSQKIDGQSVQTEYAVFSDIYKLVAERLGVKPAEAQSLSWFANGQKTGLASEPKTIVELIDDRVDVTAQLTGMSKDEVFSKFFKGSIPLLSVAGGATLLETGASMDDGEDL